jgi:hypothetical protein
MNRSFGHAPPSLEALESALRLLLFAEKLPLRWSDCSATSNFLSTYYESLFAEWLSPAGTNDLVHSVAYLANELMENAVKFRAAGEIEVEAGVLGHDFILRVGHHVSPEKAEAFATLLGEITQGDPGELLIQRIEANAETPGAGGSGLGLLTLMNDYRIRFSWNFTPAGGGDERFLLQTLARLPFPEENATPSSPQTRAHHHGN